MLSAIPLALLALPVALALPRATTNIPLTGPATTTVHREASPTFASLTTFDFTHATALPSGLQIDSGTVGTTPLAHSFDESNVVVADGFLQLKVPGGQAGKQVISCAEVATTFKVKHASVRTYAVLTDVPGVCNGMFLYKSDSQETDIEWLSDPASTSNIGAHNGTRAMQYTNQAVNGVYGDATSLFGPSIPDATSHVHEYRLDWTAEYTKFYMHGALQQTMTTNVPTEAGPWVWNNWVDGDPNWTCGPPTTDAIFKIRKIVMAYDPA